MGIIRVQFVVYHEIIYSATLFNRLNALGSASCFNQLNQLSFINYFMINNSWPVIIAISNHIPLYIKLNINYII